MRLLTLKQVKEITLLSTAKIYRLMKKDKFPNRLNYQREHLDGLRWKY